MRFHPICKWKFENSKEYDEFQITSTDSIFDTIADAMLAKPDQNQNYTYNASNDIPNHDYLVHNVVEILDETIGLSRKKKAN